MKIGALAKLMGLEMAYEVDRLWWRIFCPPFGGTRFVMRRMERVL